MLLVKEVLNSIEVIGQITRGLPFTSKDRKSNKNERNNTL